MINYNLLAAAKHAYEQMGYQYIEVPWLVSQGINDITRPYFAKPYIVTKGDKTKSLIASGEQGFLYLMAKGHLPRGKYQTITPCIRNDDFDETHVKYFMKLELINAHVQSYESELDYSTVEDAMSFFKGFCEPGSISFVPTNPGWDLEYHGVEIGSYGYRSSRIGNWIYGTGLAEPRFSRLLKENGRISD